MGSENTGGWRAFWMPFAVGWALFIFMAATNSRLATEASPMGILDHQSAATAARVNDIQHAWAAAGALDFAQVSIGLDLVFIGLVTLGGVIACALIARRAPVLPLKGLAVVTGLVWLVYAGADYAETICQAVQVNTAGRDDLAGLAASVGLVKTVTFLIAHLDLLIALLWFRAARGKTVAAV